MRLIRFDQAPLIRFLLFMLSGPRIVPLVSAEKTLCERRLATLPPGLFYYQRIELTSAAQCAERCVDDWEFCRSAVLIEHIRNKSLCQLYGNSFESRIPLNLPQVAPLQADPDRLLPITLVELTDAPCSSKFARQSTVFDQIGAGAREQLRLIPGPAVRNRLDLAVFNEKAVETAAATDATAPERLEHLRERDSLEQQQQQQQQLLVGIGEAGRAGKGVDETYLAPFSASSFKQQQSIPSSSDYAVLVGQQPPLQFPRGGLPIQPAIVSRGNQQQYNIGCPNGNCPKIGVQLGKDDVEAPCAARKSSDPCAPQSQWLEWTSSGSCSVTCGSGWRERRRYCSSGNQEKCKGDATDREKCVMPTCNQWTEWTEWTQCSASCGGGQQMKQRSCQNGDQCVGASVESRKCNEERCPTWTNWGAWGECSATCGTGTQKRVRECEPRHNANAICAVGNAVEHRECESRSCPEWAQWEPWSTCSKSCGAGESVRRRECRNAASKEECQGAATERLLCNTQFCATWTTWTEWTPCSKKCGSGGTQTRKRECRYNGMSSEECAGAAREEKQCQSLEACPSWTEWGEWSDCTTTCGDGHQSRNRKCLPSGYGCAGNEKDVRQCQKAECPYFDQWSEWGGCSVTCGRGFCERRRKCIKNTDELGKKLQPLEAPMPIREEMTEGTKREKGGPEDITSADTLRPRTLEVIQSSSVRRSPLISAKLGLLDEDKIDRREAGGTGIQYDTKILPISSGECVGPSVERKACEAGPCCNWSQWSPWSDCNVQCGSTGYRERSRRCEMTQTPAAMTSVDENALISGSASHSPIGITNFAQQPPTPFLFANARNNAFGGIRCAICVGDSRQTESCAIPTPKSICRDQPNADGELPGMNLRAKSKPDLSLFREGFGGRDDVYVTVGKVGRAVDNKRKEVGEANKSNNNNNNNGGDDYGTSGEENAPIGAKTKDERKRSSTASETATSAAALMGNNNCGWTQWSAWSDCGGAECSKRRSRTCDAPVVDVNKCQCEGEYEDRTKCPPEECRQKLRFMDETIGEMSLTTKLLDREDKPLPPSSSFIKRVQLIPRHKASEAEKRREEERRQRNNNAPLTLDSSAKLIRISGLRISGDQKPSSDCGVDDWLQWSEWSA
uniref:Apple domain-containing protein n=1 Tax=Globodera pallida TaxID=36090 RepID=A0A183C8U8_GLOPA